MRNLNDGWGGDVGLSMFVGSSCCTMIAVLLTSCGASLPVLSEAQQTGDGGPAAPYSIVCVIHGDGTYLYHDTRGIEYQADEEALAEMKRVAMRNSRAEVFIFHQKPREHFLFFFPFHDGEFYYYRNGRLVASEPYWRDQGRSRFDPEVGLYRRFRVNGGPESMNVFLYFGHEIPEFGGEGYDASYPNRPFTVHDLADGLQGFTDRSAKFDLMVLSTCFGSTPYTIGELGSFARYIVASPDNLHLSYFDLWSLGRLDLSLRDGDLRAFAKKFARLAFRRLTTDTQTAVSVAVYDVERVQEFLQSVHGAYDRTLTTLRAEAPLSIERCDCADLPAYVQPTMNEGVDVLYRPARFGRLKHKQGHSGWECWRERSLDSPFIGRKPQ